MADAGSMKTRDARLDRLAFRFAFTGGALSVLVALLVLVIPGYYLFSAPAHYVVPLAEGAALLAVLVALTGLRPLQRGRYGGIGKVGFAAAFAGTLLAGAGHLAGLPFLEFVNTGSVAYVLIGLSQGVVLGWGLTYVLGAFAMSAGFALLGLATAGTRTLPLWCGPVLIGGLAGLWFLGNAGGWAAFGLAWLLTGYAMRSSGQAKLRSSRVR